MSSACFSKKSLDEQKIWSKRGLYSDLESLSESEFGRPNNNVDKMFDFFFEIPLPREARRYAPGHGY